MVNRIKNRSAAFTLVEVLVALAVLALLVAMMGQLFNNTSMASSVSATHIEADARVRLLFGRMAADFSHMVRRTDVDYFIKSPAHPLWAYSTTQSAANLQTGTVGANDQIAFYSEVPGYSSVSGAENSVSLVAYRVNTTGTLPCIERLGTALSWGGGSSSILPVSFLPGTIAGNWPTATLTPSTSSTSDPAYDQNYETIVPEAFRFEYYYQLHSGALSATPWDTTAGHTMISGLQDVAGIGVVIAVTDRKASAVVSSSSLQTLAAQMKDFPTAFPSGLTVGGLQQNWQSTVATSSLPAVVRNGIRVYEQVFCIDPPSQ